MDMEYTLDRLLYLLGLEASPLEIPLILIPTLRMLSLPFLNNNKVEKVLTFRVMRKSGVIRRAHSLSSLPAPWVINHSHSSIPD